MQLKNVIGKNQKQYFKIVGWGFIIKIQFFFFGKIKIQF